MICFLSAFRDVMKLNKSAVGLAFLRGVESAQHQDVRFFEDKLALSLLPGTMFKLFSGLVKLRFVRNKIIKTYEKSVNGMYGGMICRTRYFDEKTQQSINNGVKNVVIIGAGLDTRAYRLQGIEQCQVFELDNVAMSTYKQKTLNSIGHVNQQHVTYLSINFDTQTLQSVLSQQGFDATQKTLFIWEGISQYRSAEQVDEILSFIATCASGSELLMTYIIKQAITGNNAKVGWQFALEPKQVEPLLAKHKLTLQQDIDGKKYNSLYIIPSKRALATFDIERFVYATVN